MIRVIIKTRKNENEKYHVVKLDHNGFHPKPKWAEHIFTDYTNYKEPRIEFYWQTPENTIEKIGEVIYRRVEESGSEDKYVLVKNTTPYNPPKEIESNYFEYTMREFAWEIYTDLMNTFKSTYFGKSLEEAEKKLKKETPRMPRGYWFLLYIMKKEKGYYKGWKIYSSFERAKEGLKRALRESPCAIFGYTFKKRSYYFVIDSGKITYYVFDKYTECVEKRKKIKDLKAGLKELVEDVKREKEMLGRGKWHETKKIRAKIVNPDETIEGEFTLHELVKHATLHYFKKLIIWDGKKKLLELEYRSAHYRNWRYRDTLEPVCLYIDPGLKKIVEQIETYEIDPDSIFEDDRRTFPLVDFKTGKVWNLKKLLGAVYVYVNYGRRTPSVMRSTRTYERWEGLVAPQTIPSKEGVIFVRVILERRGGIEYYDISVRGKDAIKRLVEVIKEAFSHNAVAVVFSTRVKRHIKAIFVVSRKGTEAILYDLRTDEFVKKKTSIRNAIKMVMGNVGREAQAQT